ncbi:MAG: hypothetical protein WCP55_02495 [Lentisphaerota bacterium]
MSNKLHGNAKCFCGFRKKPDGGGDGNVHGECDGAMQRVESSYNK